MAQHGDARLRKILWTVYWRGNAQLRERVEDELRPQDQPKKEPKKELRARIAGRRGDLSQAAALAARCPKELPGHQAYLHFAVEVGAELPSAPAR